MHVKAAFLNIIFDELFISIPTHNDNAHRHTTYVCMHVKAAFLNIIFDELFISIPTHNDNAH
jgi:hypothetical protein